MPLEQGKHVMLSYQWNSKNVVSKIYNILQASGIKVWMDINGGMGDNVNKSMGDAVDNAAVVCCFLTSDYQNSYNCQLELQYAVDLDKLYVNQPGKFRIIPCMLSDKKNAKWKPSGWLGLAIAGRQWVNMRDDSDSNIELKAIELISRIKGSPSVPAKETIPKFLEFYEPIKKNYLQQNRINLMVNQEKSFPIQQSYINLTLVESKEQTEKEEKLKQQHDKILGTFEDIYGTKTSIDAKDIFEKCKDQTKKVLILGRAGIGKSTFCQYVTYLWAKGELWSQYVLVILIRLRLLTDNRYPHGKKYLPIDLLEKQYFQCDDISNEVRRHFKEQCSKGKVLWILDGYDEFVQNIPEQLQDVFDHICQTQHHILTSRPYAIELHYDTKMEITGFIDENIEKYITQFFEHIKGESTDFSFPRQNLREVLKSNSSIWGIAHVPVNLELICSLWSDTDLSEMTTVTVTKLYDSIVLWLCRRYLIRKQSKVAKQSQNVVYHECHKELSFLERLAFYAMKNNSIIIPPKLLKDIQKYDNCSDVDFLQVLNIGILKPYDDKAIGTTIPTESQYYFVHLSFQEYLAARHLLTILKNSDNKRAIKFINNNKYNQRFMMVFIFVTGLLSQSDNQSCNELYWSVIESQPIDLLGWRHIRLIIECFDEMHSELFMAQRAVYITRIEKYMEYCISAVHDILTEHLGESFKKSQSIGADCHIQNALIRLLNKPETYTKLNTLNILSHMMISKPSSTLLSILCTILQHEDDRFRAGACRALGKMGEIAATRQVIDALLNALKDQYVDVKTSACRALGYMGETAATTKVIDALLNTFTNAAHFLRIDAYEALRMICEKTTTSKVIDALLNALRDENDRVVSNACEALEEMGEKAATMQVVDSLLNTLKHESHRVRRKARVALGTICEKAATTEVIGALLNALKNEDSYVGFRSRKTHGKISKKAATENVFHSLRNSLEDDYTDIKVGTCEALGRMGGIAATTKVIDVLLNALKDKVHDVRRGACEALGKICEEVVTAEVIDALVNALKDEQSQVDFEARQALAKIGKKAATTNVIRALLNAVRNEDKTMRQNACEVLGTMGEKAATDDVVDALLNALKDEDEHVRTKACETLGKVCEEAPTIKVIDALLVALKDKKECVRRSVCKTLEEMGEKVATKNVTDALISALNDQEKWVIRDACKALLKICGKTVTEEMIDCLINAVINEEEYVKNDLYEALGKIGKKEATKKVIEVLVKAINDKNSQTRREACIALGTVGERAATKEVIDALLNALYDSSSDVVIGACVALQKIDVNVETTEMIYALLKVLKNGDHWMRREARAILGNIGERTVTHKGIGALLDALMDNTNDVKMAAYEVLMKMGNTLGGFLLINNVINILDNTRRVSYDWEFANILNLFLGFCGNLKRLDSAMISKINIYLRRNKFVDARSIQYERLLNVFLETENDAWLPVLVLIALLQGTALTMVENGLVLYGTKEPMQIHVYNRRALEKLVQAYVEQKTEILGNSVTIQFKNDRSVNKQKKVS